MQTETRLDSAISSSVQNIMKKKFAAALFGMWILSKGEAPPWMIFGLAIAVIIAQLVQDVMAQRSGHPVPSPEPETPDTETSVESPARELK